MDVKDLLPIGMIVVVTGIGVAFGLQVLGDVKGDMTTDSEEYNATGEAVTAVAKIPSKLGIIVTVLIAALLIGILVKYLFFRS